MSIQQLRPWDRILGGRKVCAVCGSKPALWPLADGQVVCAKHRNSDHKRV